MKTDIEMEMVLEKMEKIKKQGEREGRFLKVGILFGNEDQTVILNIILKHFSSIRIIKNYETIAIHHLPLKDSVDEEVK